jgi:enamine deaminase RidA (YjgF/YER057c/UK114 family)
MTIERLDITAPPGPVSSRCVVHGDMVYLGGLSAAHAGSDVATQTKAVLGLVDGYLERTGSDRMRILTVQVWLADMAQFAAMNEVWNAWVDRSHPPLRACVNAQLAAPGALVEMLVVATR